MNTTPQSRPILFSAPMVRAILEGRKTQTRRAINPQPEYWVGGCGRLPYKSTSKKPSKNGTVWQGEDGYCYEPIKCLYGQVGTHLWVRETFYAYGYWLEIGKRNNGKPKYQFTDVTRERGYDYKYDELKPDFVRTGFNEMGWYKRPSLFMPREASRITLEITGIRVERLHDMTEQDCINEGIEVVGGIDFDADTRTLYRNYEAENSYFADPHFSFYSLWDKINGENSWIENPWIWVIEFKNVSQK